MQSTTSPHPAIRAGRASISTVEKSGALPPGDVEPHAADGYGTLHAPHAGHHFDVDLRRELGPVEGFDIGLGDRKRRLEPLRHGFGRFGALPAGNLEPLGDVTFDAGHEVAQRLVAAPVRTCERMAATVP